MTHGDKIRVPALSDTAGSPAFPEVNTNKLLGIPIITSGSVPHSTSAGTIIALVNASGIAFGEIPTADVDVTTEATLQMDSAPTNNSATPTATQLVDLFSTNSTAIRVVRYCNWSRIRAASVGYVDNVHL